MTKGVRVGDRQGQRKKKKREEISIDIKYVIHSLIIRKECFELFLSRLVDKQ